MATRLHNLSEFDSNKFPPKEMLQKQGYVIVVADWNSEITYALAEGAYNTLIESGVLEENILIQHVPGTIELTYAAARYVNLSLEEHTYVDVQHSHSVKTLFPDSLHQPHLSAIIAIGCVIKGDTPHFDYVCQSVTTGIANLNVHGSIPVVFSVLTTLDKQQALDRAGGKLGNKGIEGAYTAIRMANLSIGNNSDIQNMKIK